MNRKILISMIAGMTITYGCVKQNELDQRVRLLESDHEIYTVELGSELPMNALDFIDEANTSSKMLAANKSITYYSKVDGVGVYEGELLISNQRFPISVNVVDRISPTVTLKDSRICFAYGTDLNNYDFTKHIEVSDLSETTINVKHQIDSNKAGTYEVFFEVSDESNNHTVCKMEVVVGEKVIKTSTPKATSKNKYDFSNQFEIVDYQDADHWTMNYYGDWHYLGENCGGTFYGADLLPLPEDVMSGKVTFDK